ncbi:MAG: type I phosphomannose isomerase catalytic subunit [Weeksellaceae bacterium]
MRRYPIKFVPITKYRIWGGDKLNRVVPEKLQMDRLGEIWSISGVEGDLSVVENGELKGRNLKEILEEYKEKLVGKEVWEKFGNEFPLLIKFIDAADDLSVQVHPNDELAQKKHNSFGKSEMWYIMEAEKNAALTIGLKEGITKNDYQEHLTAENLEKILNQVKVQKGDAVYIPAGRVHAIGAGIVLAEIQQTSDITYRIYDYNRIDKDGKKRELHTESALEAIDFKPIGKPIRDYDKTENRFNPLIRSPYFETRIFTGNQEIQIKNNNEMRIYCCVGGKSVFWNEDNPTELMKFQSLMIPANLHAYKIIPENNCVLLEVRMPQ